MTDITVDAKHISLANVIETISGPARVMALSWEDGNVRIEMAFLNKGVMPDGKATLCVNPDARFEVREL